MASAQRTLRRAKEAATGVVEEAQFRVWSLTSAGRSNARSVRRLRGAHKGRRAFVMGNGPSLLKCDLNRLDSEVTIVSNAHYLIWDQLSYVPTFLTVEDRLVAEDRASELRDIHGTTRIFPFDLRPFLGPAASDKLYLNFPRSYRPFPRFSRDLARQAFWGGTVSYLNLQIAAYLGCNPIVLIGFDHSYSVPSGSIHDHVIHSDVEDVNHIHPNYFGPGYRWHDPNVARMEASYRFARAELESCGVQVLNATVGGHLEVFDRISFDSCW